MTRILIQGERRSIRVTDDAGNEAMVLETRTHIDGVPTGAVNRRLSGSLEPVEKIDATRYRKRDGQVLTAQ